MGFQSAGIDPGNVGLQFNFDLLFDPQLSLVSCREAEKKLINAANHVSQHFLMYNSPGDPESAWNLIGGSSYLISWRNYIV